MPSEDITRIFQEFEQRQATIEAAHRRLRELGVTRHSPRREVSVSVDHSGTVTGLQFSGTAYRRLTPQELADLIMQTMTDAREQVIDQAAEIMSAVLPPAMDARAMLRGDFQPQDLFTPARKEK